eukprot:TRINITY_DN4375_c0_g1_i12.p1 TRINITY_DN4375_c0_g1~~TRINITY_DN4375_c0_g1_i12.p1  ORF type:complete len:232 (-),score=26.64 TRINITY_DN4375_c0_g1_i12:456-1151(-)
MRTTCGWSGLPVHSFGVEFSFDIFVTVQSWAIYYNSRKVITYIIHLPEVDITRHVGWWYESALPDSSLSPLVERLAPKISFTKTLYSVTGLDLAVILGNVEVVEEMMRLSLSWNRKFHDPLGWALDWAKKFQKWSAGDMEGLQEAPRKVIVDEYEVMKFSRIIEILRAEGATDQLPLDPIWEMEHTVKSIYPPKEIITVIRRIDAVPPKLDRTKKRRQRPRELQNPEGLKS